MNGYLSFRGQHYPVQARREGQALSGSFRNGIHAFAFRAEPSAGGLDFRSDDSRFSLRKTAPAQADPAIIDSTSVKQ